MEQTEYYGLNKPGENDYADVAVLNENAGTVDAALHGLETGKADLDPVTGRLVPAQAPTAKEIMAADGQSVEAAMPNKAPNIRIESDQPLDKYRSFGWYIIQTPTSGFPPGYTSDSFFNLFVTGNDSQWSPWLLFDLRTGATFRGGYTVGQFCAWEPLTTASDLAGKADTTDHQLKTYTSLTQLSLSGAVTMEQVCAALPRDCILQFRNSLSDADKVTDAPATYTLITVKRTFGGYTHCDAWDNVGRILYQAGYQYNATPAFGGWVPIATTTPPQELDLPLAAGFEAQATCKYWLTQDGETKTSIRLGVLSGTAYGQICATLPAGYRPQSARSVTCMAYQSQSGVAPIHGIADAYPDGTIRLYLQTQTTGAGDIFINPFVFVAAYGSNTLQSQVRMPTTRMAFAAITEESTDRCMCVVDADGNYVEFVMVTITHDELGALYTVHYYELRDGERLIDTAPPSMRPHVGADGFVRARWDDDAAAWTEGATAEGIAAWEAEHPAPDASPMSELTMTQLAVTELVQVVEENNTSNQLAIAELAEALMGGEPSGETVL